MGITSRKLTAIVIAMPTPTHPAKIAPRSTKRLTRAPGRRSGRRPLRRPGARVSRFVDRGAIFAGWVGVGMAMTIAVSFLLVIPIEPVFWLMSPLAGLLIGYYANARADRRAGPWQRILLNGVYASVLTAVTLALLFAGTKAIFFFADNGY